MFDMVRNWASYLRNPTDIFGSINILNIPMGKQMAVALVASIIVFYLIIKAYQETPFRRGY